MSYLGLFVLIFQEIGIINGALNYLGQDDQNKVQHYFLCHVIPLALVSYDANVSINGTITFLWSKQSKSCAT